MIQKRVYNPTHIETSVSAKSFLQITLIRGDGFMSNDTLKVLEAIRKQFEAEAATRDAMLEILDQGEVEEDDIPQNSNLGAVIKILIKNEKDVFSAIQKLELEYKKIGEYKCFKVDDETSGIEDIYFISSTEILYLESGCLNIF